MPNRHRPSPEFPITGFLGEQQTASGNTATELNTTIPHPTLFDKWTNTPLLVPGQQATDALLSGQRWPTDEQEDRASDFAAFLLAHGVELPVFDTPEEADAGAGHRHKQFEKIVRALGPGPTP
jgi:hypothetical protein